jgi:hypothetical protein
MADHTAVVPEANGYLAPPPGTGGSKSASESKSNSRAATVTRESAFGPDRADPNASHGHISTAALDAKAHDTVTLPTVTTLAGHADGVAGHIDGRPTLARFDGPTGVVVDWRAAVIISDSVRAGHPPRCAAPQPLNRVLTVFVVLFVVLCSGITASV